MTAIPRRHDIGIVRQTHRPGCDPATCTLDAMERPAAACRRRGWEAGTVLVGDEGYGDKRIVITAIGDEEILAHEVGRRRPGGSVDPR